MGRVELERAHPAPGDKLLALGGTPQKKKVRAAINEEGRFVRFVALESGRRPTEFHLSFDQVLDLAAKISLVQRGQPLNEVSLQEVLRALTP